MTVTSQSLSQTERYTPVSVGTWILDTLLYRWSVIPRTGFPPSSPQPTSPSEEDTDLLSTGSTYREVNHPLTSDPHLPVCTETKERCGRKRRETSSPVSTKGLPQCVCSILSISTSDTPVHSLCRLLLSWTTLPVHIEDLVVVCVSTYLKQLVSLQFFGILTLETVLTSVSYQTSQGRLLLLGGFGPWWHPHPVSSESV